MRRLSLFVTTCAWCFTLSEAAASNEPGSRVGPSSSHQQEDQDTIDSTWSSYGLDVSFPIHKPVSTRYPWLSKRDRNSYKDMPVQPLGNRQEAYMKHLMGCRERYKASNTAEMCDSFEYHRLLMNQRQPMSMKNYTDTGFLKTKAPEKVIQLINQFWQQNQHKGKPEVWPDGSIYINHWETPTILVSVDDVGLRGSGAQLKTQIWSAASALMEASLPGTVRLMFQPAEEGGAGGKRMREEGVLQKHPAPSYAFGLHVWPTLPSGTVATRPGPLMAACERFEVLVHGVGGHAASECTNLY